MACFVNFIVIVRFEIRSRSTLVAAERSHDKIVDPFKRCRYYATLSLDSTAMQFHIPLCIEYNGPRFRMIQNFVQQWQWCWSREFVHLISSHEMIFRFFSLRFFQEFVARGALHHREALVSGNAFSPHGLSQLPGRFSREMCFNAVHNCSQLFIVS